MASSVNPIVISPNCKQVTITNPLPDLGGPYTISISSATGSVSSQSFPATGVVTIPCDVSGVVVATIKNTEGLTVTILAAVATCKIDCCIAKLVESAINCTCKCDKCKEELDRAEKIFLLLQSAVYIVSATDQNIKDAQEKYAKANELCTEVCACGC